MKAFKIRIPNEGGRIFCYDEAHSDKLRKAKIVSLVERVSKSRSRVPNFDALARAGSIVTFDIVEDNDVRLDVRIGDPPGAGPRSPEPQRAFLDLPSGRLRFDSYQTLPLWEDRQEGAEGALIEIPSGRYVFTLFRNGEGKEKLVTLTPTARPPAGETRGWLPCVFHTPAPLAPSTVAGDVWTGAVANVDWEDFTINLDKARGRKLGIRFGAALRLEIGKLDARAVFSGRLRNWDADLHAGIAKAVAGGALLADWYPLEERKGAVEWLTFLAGASPLPKARRGVEAKLTVLPEPYEAYDRSWLDRWSVEKGELRGEVLSCGSIGHPAIGEKQYSIFTNIDRRALDALGMPREEPFLVRIGDTEVRGSFLGPWSMDRKPDLWGEFEQHYFVDGQMVLKLVVARGERVPKSLLVAPGTPVVLRGARGARR